MPLLWIEVGNRPFVTPLRNFNRSSSHLVKGENTGVIFVFAKGLKIVPSLGVEIK